MALRVAGVGGAVMDELYPLRWYSGKLRSSVTNRKGSIESERFGLSYDMWDADEYKAFSDARGHQCAHATALVSKWVVELL